MKTVTGLFDSYEDASGAVGALEAVASRSTTSALFRTMPTIATGMKTMTMVPQKVRVPVPVSALSSAVQVVF